LQPISGRVDGILRSLSAAMNGNELLLFPAVALVAYPLLVLLHELGHAAVALSRTEGLVHVRVGRAPGWLRGRWGRLSFSLSPLRAPDAAGFALPFARMPPAERIAFALAGPAASLAVAAVFVPAAIAQHGRARTALAFIGGIAIYQGLFNLVPREVRGRKSDGLHALEQFRRLSHPPRPALDGSSTDGFLRDYDATWSRWYALLTNPPTETRTDARAIAITRIAHELISATQPRELSPFIFAGWCWRHVERPAAEAPLVIRQAIDAAIDDGSRDVELRVAATLAALQEDLDPATLEPPSRRGFLARAIRDLPQRAETQTTEQMRRQSFLAGVVLHDVEAAAPPI
jgi:hypothetical protein